MRLGLSNLQQIPIHPWLSIQFDLNGFPKRYLRRVEIFSLGLQRRDRQTRRQFVALVEVLNICFGLIVKTCFRQSVYNITECVHAIWQERVLQSLGARRHQSAERAFAVAGFELSIRDLTVDDKAFRSLLQSLERRLCFLNLAFTCQSSCRQKPIPLFILIKREAWKFSRGTCDASTLHRIVWSHWYTTHDTNGTRREPCDCFVLIRVRIVVFLSCDLW